jgi:hypothetical protein
VWIDKTGEFIITTARDVANETAGAAATGVRIVPTLPRTAIGAENEPFAWDDRGQNISPATVVTGVLQINVSGTEH